MVRCYSVHAYALENILRRYRMAKQEAESIHGGILADDVGVGDKTELCRVLTISPFGCRWV